MSSPPAPSLKILIVHLPQNAYALINNLLWLIAQHFSLRRTFYQVKFVTFLILALFLISKAMTFFIQANNTTRTVFIDFIFAEVTRKLRDKKNLPGIDLLTEKEENFKRKSNFMKLLIYGKAFLVELIYSSIWCKKWNDALR